MLIKNWPQLLLRQPVDIVNCWWLFRVVWDCWTGYDRKSATNWSRTAISIPGVWIKRLRLNLLDFFACVRRNGGKMILETDRQSRNSRWLNPPIPHQHVSDASLTHLFFRRSNRTGALSYRWLPLLKPEATLVGEFAGLRALHVHPPSFVMLPKEKYGIWNGWLQWNPGPLLTAKINSEMFVKYSWPK